MNTLFHRLSLAGLMFTNPVELFDRIGRDPCYRGEMIDWIESLALEPGARILELGCGPGAVALELARQGYIVSAVDRSERMIAKLAETAKAQALHVDTRSCDACATGLPDASFDAVIGASLLNVVKEPPALVAEALRLLTPGGKASFYYPGPSFNRRNVKRFIRAKNLSDSSAAILLTWSGVAKKLDSQDAEELFSAACAQHIRLNKHLDGMIGSIAGQAAT